MKESKSQLFSSQRWWGVQISCTKMDAPPAFIKGNLAMRCVCNKHEYKNQPFWQSLQIRFPMFLGAKVHFFSFPNTKRRGKLAVSFPLYLVES